MRGVGPAGRIFRMEKVSGRRMARAKGGMSEQGGMAVSRKD